MLNIKFKFYQGIYRIRTRVQKRSLQIFIVSYRPAIQGDDWIGISQNYVLKQPIKIMTIGTAKYDHFQKQYNQIREALRKASLEMQEIVKRYNDAGFKEYLANYVAAKKDLKDTYINNKSEMKKLVTEKLCKDKYNQFVNSFYGGEALKQRLMMTDELFRREFDPDFENALAEYSQKYKTQIFFNEVTYTVCAEFIKNILSYSTEIPNILSEPRKLI